jgi:hypothetical protein
MKVAADNFKPRQLVKNRVSRTQRHQDRLSSLVPALTQDSHHQPVRIVDDRRSATTWALRRGAGDAVLQQLLHPLQAWQHLTARSHLARPMPARMRQLECLSAIPNAPEPGQSSCLHPASPHPRRLRPLLPRPPVALGTGSARTTHGGIEQ